MQTRPLSVTVASALLVALAGCGGGGDPGAPTAIGGASEVAPPPQAALPVGGPITPSPGAPAARTAKECADPRAFRTGYRVRAQHVNADGSTADSEVAFAGSAQRNGRTVAVFQGSLPVARGSMTQFTYREPAGDEVLEHGLRIVAQADGKDGEAEVLPTVGIPIGFALAVGGSASTGTVSIRLTSRATGEADVDRTAVAQYVIRFVGFETITTAAGRFVDTCRIEVTETRDGATTTRTTWWGNGLGVPVQQRDPEGRLQRLAALAINGELVAGRFATGGGTPTPPPATGPGSGGVRR